MKRRIVKFDTDVDGHWRVELDCGHYQHVRHDPPLRNREWVLDENERAKRVGAELNCVKCERTE